MMTKEELKEYICAIYDLTDNQFEMLVSLLEVLKAEVTQQNLEYVLDTYKDLEL